MAQTPIPEGHYLDLPMGLRLHYHLRGPEHGHVVVFLHGSGPGASGWSNFRHNIDVLTEAGYRCLVPDLPGYGLSDKPEDREYVNDFFVQALAELLDGLGLQQPVSLLGNSLGGAIALGYTLAQPGRIASLILMAPGGVEEREAYFEMEGIRKMVALFAEGPLDNATMRKLLEYQLHDPGQVSDEVVAERVAVCAQQPRTVLSTMRVPNMEARLGEITCPVLGFWGMNDKFNPLSGAEKIARGCPQARMILINRCGHWVMVEHRDFFNRTCIDFLDHEVAQP